MSDSIDSKTLLPEPTRLREDLGIEQLVVVGDRGMNSGSAIKEPRATDGWLGARP